MISFHCLNFRMVNKFLKYDGTNTSRTLKSVAAIPSERECVRDCAVMGVCAYVRMCCSTIFICILFLMENYYSTYLALENEI